jgi:hypothetical protein
MCVWCVFASPLLEQVFAFPDSFVIKPQSSVTVSLGAVASGELAWPAVGSWSKGTVVQVTLVDKDDNVVSRVEATA